MPLRERFARLWRNEKGNALLLGAASLPVLIGSAGLAVDTVQLSLWKRQLQRAADSAALAGAHARAQGRTATASAERDLTLNNRVPLSQRTIEPPPTSGPYAGNPNAVRVILATQQRTGFMGFFNRTPPLIRTEATAAVVVNGKFCMIALEDTNVTGVTFSGNTTVDLGCGVSSNSRAAVAISAGGSSSIKATPIMAVGGVPSSASYVQPTTLIPYSPKQADPFANLPLPSPSNCQNELKINPNSTRENIGPTDGGAVCYNGLDIKGSVNLRPGTYFINGGNGNNVNNLSLGAQANVTGTGVTIIFTNTNTTRPPAGLSIHGQAVLNLVAPDQGPYKGVLFYQDPRAPALNSVTINGTSGSRIEGGMYFPRAHLTFNGTTNMVTECMQLVARRLTFSGNSQVNNTCRRDGGSQAFDGLQVKLVG
jgi:hypothetical protein